MALSILSPAFEPNTAIPERFTCDGADIAPPLGWSGAPPGTASFALIMQDPDAPDPAAPKRTYVHWVLYNIPASVRELPEGVTSDALPDGTREGINDWNRTGYGGPCPPIGRHRYFFRLFALDTVLEGLDRPTRDELEQAMRGHILAQAELVGTYEHPVGARR